MASTADIKLNAKKLFNSDRNILNYIVKSNVNPKASTKPHSPHLDGLETSHPCYNPDHADTARQTAGPSPRVLA